MDRGYSEDLLEDLQALTELHKQFMGPGQYISEVMAYCTHLAMECANEGDEVGELLKKAVEDGINAYKKGLENADIKTD